MESKEALQLVEGRLGIPLNDNERDLLKGVLENLDVTQTYKKYFDGRIQKAHLSRNVAPKLWRKLGSAFGEKVRMRNVRGAIERVHSRLLLDDAAIAQSSVMAESSSLQFTQPASATTSAASDLQTGNATLVPYNRSEPVQDWGSSPRVVNFCGRRETLRLVESRLRVGGCQMFSICGEAGTGKTWFAKQLSQQLIDHYEAVVWRSLDTRNPIRLGELLADIVSTITREPVAAPVSIDHFLDVLMDCPSLIVLDGIETVLAAGVVDGSYRPEFEAYGTLLQQLSQRSHYSCILVVSREKPRVFSEQRGNPLICSLSLKGLEILETQEFFQGRVSNASPAHWRGLHQLCDGNPKALRLMGEFLIGACGGDLELFLDVYEQPHEQVRSDQQAQFSRLSELEQNILGEISQLDPPVLNLRTLKALRLEAPFGECQKAHQSLIHRSLLQQCSETPSNYTIPSLMREYVSSNSSESAA